MSISDYFRWCSCCLSKEPARGDESSGLIGPQYPESLENRMEYLRYLAAANPGASLFTREQTRRFKEQRGQLIEAQPGKSCCKSETKAQRRSPVWYRACCGSRLTQCAIAAGCCLGAGAAFIGPATGYVTSKVGLLVLGAAIAGSANGSGTCLSLMDTINRDDRQDLVQEIRDLFKDLSLYMVGEFLRNHAPETRAQFLDVANHLLSNQQVLEASMSPYLQLEESGLPLLFQAALYITQNREPRDESLRNEIATINSPSLQEHRDLEARYHDLEARFADLQARLQRFEELQIEHQEVIGDKQG